MKKIFSLFAAALMSAVMFAGNLVPGDTILWTKGDATEVFGTGTNANANKWRDLAYYDGVIYAIAHSQDGDGNPRIYKFDAETGSYLGNMNVSAVWGGDIPLTSLQILDNGEVIAMGCRVSSASSGVPIYYWDSVQGVSHELMRATIANGGKRVEMLHYEGTLADGKIYLAAEKCDKITVIPVVNKAVVADQISYITLTSGTDYIGFAPRVINVTDTTISICSSTKAMTYKISDGSCLTWTDLTGTNQEGGNGVAFFEYNNEKYWASVKMGNVSAATLANPCIQVQTYTGFGRWAATGVVQKYCSAADVLPSAERNTSFTTGVAVRVNEDGYSVWACSVNHGIIAYRYVNPVDYKITVNTTAAGNFQITSANCTDVLNDGGSFKFDNATKTITLTNCHFTSGTYPLIINQSVNIVLVGENSITSTSSATALKFASGDATIGGGGKLTLSCLNTGGADGIYCPGGNLTINECEIYAEGGYGIEGASTRTLTINPGAKVTAYGPSKGSFTGWSSIVLGEGVEILSPAGAQIVGGDVKDAEGALLKSQVVIGVPAEETIPATSVTLDQDTLKMYMGVGTATLKATVLPDNTTDFVEWSVVEGGESFVSVLSGIVTALAEGEAKVVAKAGDVADTCVVVVGPAPVEYAIQVYNPAKDGMLNVNSLNCADIFGDGKLSYDPEEKVLTLNNLVMDCGGYYGIINNDVDGLTVKLLGENVLVGHSATALRLYTNTTIAGGGKLTASSENNDGCYISSGTLTINACELVMRGQWGLEGAKGTALIINEGAHITAIGTSSTGMSDGSIKGYGSITLNGVQILSPAGAQIIGGTVYDAEGAVLKTEVVIGTPAPAGFKGAYTVGGEGADFASLYAACDSVNKAVIAGNLAGDIELLIAADLEERNCAIVNNTDYTVTIRPDQDVKRTITFTATTDANTGPSGALMVGVHMANNIQHTDTIPTKNVIIDGLAFEGATNKMEITTVSNFHNSGYLVVFYGPVRNSAIKNCIITNNRTSGSTYGVTLRTMNANVGHSDGVLVEGNEITCTASGAGQCIYFCAGSVPEAEVPVNCIVRNNILTAKSRGVFLNGEKDIIIDGNEFHIKGGSGFHVAGIYGNKNYGSIKVINNRFVEMTTANGSAGDYGMTGILASGGGTFTIENNFFGGLDATCTAQPTRLVSVRCGSPCIVRHNTFVMDELTGTPSTGLLSTNPISCLYLAANGMTVQNNIFVSHETVAHNSLIRGTMTEDMTGNLFYIDAEEQGNAVIVDGATPAATFAELDSAIQVKSINAKIELVENYKLAEDYVGLKIFAVPAIEGITTDIEGNVRHTPNVYVGCFEPADAPVNEPSTPSNLNEIKADAKAVKVMRNGHVFIIRDGKMFNMQGMIVK